MKIQHTLLLAALLVACAGSEHESGKDSETAEDLGSSTAVEEGHTRYYSSVQELKSGESLNLVEWIAPALDQDMDVVGLKGGQTVGGHHVTVNSSTAIEAIGTVRPYVNTDQLTGKVVGAVGGEGTSGNATNFPEGYVFRVYKGQGLYLQTHYINLTESTIKVRSYVDVKLGAPSADRKVLTLFANSTLTNRLPALSQSSQTVECVTKEDLSLLMFTNHMHEYGKSVRTEAILPDGTMMMLKDDPAWNYEWESNPNYTRAFDHPVQLPKGTTLRTTCSWDNTTDKDLTFPDEMCVFVGFQAGEVGFTCADGQWQTVNPRAGTEAPASAAPVTRVGDGACSGEADFSALPELRDACMAKPREDITGCGLPLLQGNSQCIVDCFVEGNVSQACGTCYGAFTACNAMNCASDCSADPKGEACTTCQETKCCGDFEACSGVSCSG